MADNITCAVPTPFHLSKASAMRTAVRLGIRPTVTAATDKDTALTPAIFNIVFVYNGMADITCAVPTPFHLSKASDMQTAVRLIT